jgi:hypothetical protein
VGTPSRRVVDALQDEVDTPAAVPPLRSPLMSPLRRTGVRGAPQRVATPAAERHASGLLFASRVCCACTRCCSAPQHLPESLWQFQRALLPER